MYWSMHFGIETPRQIARQQTNVRRNAHEHKRKIVLRAHCTRTDQPKFHDDNWQQQLHHEPERTAHTHTFRVCISLERGPLHGPNAHNIHLFVSVQSSNRPQSDSQFYRPFIVVWLCAREHSINEMQKVTFALGPFRPISSYLIPFAVAGPSIGRSHVRSSAAHRCQDPRQHAMHFLLPLANNCISPIEFGAR